MKPMSNRQEPKLVLGIMSGTSADSIDVCGVRLYQTPEETLSFEVVGLLEYPLPEALKTRLLACMGGSSLKARDICLLNTDVGEAFASAAQAFISQFQLSATDIFCIGSHGQTISHIPPKNGVGGTLQIGEPCIIAERTGITTVADFRPRDMAAGGQGAPLVSFADKLLFQNPTLGRCIQNIGGIANVTALPPKTTLDSDASILAFDTGPGNMLIDTAMTKFFGKPMDLDGEMASFGQLDDEILAFLLDHPFLRKAPPRTTGREQFGSFYLEELLEKFPRVHKEHLLATLTFFTAKTIADAYKTYIIPQMPIHEVIMGGGGTFNKTLMRDITRLLQGLNPDIVIKTHDDFGISNKAKEGLAFAVLAWATLYGMPNNIPSCTGAKHPVILGKIIPGALS
jgi:anhydro-N-acetylmuramic acid kinase